MGKKQVNQSNVGNMASEPHIMRPCPFCGSIPIIKKVKWLDIIAASVRCENDDCWIQPCTGMVDEKRAIEMWNLRA